MGVKAVMQPSQGSAKKRQEFQLRSFDDPAVDIYNAGAFVTPVLAALDAGLHPTVDLRDVPALSPLSLALLAAIRAAIRNRGRSLLIHSPTPESETYRQLAHTFLGERFRMLRKSPPVRPLALYVDSRANEDAYGDFLDAHWLPASATSGPAFRDRAISRAYEPYANGHHHSQTSPGVVVTASWRAGIASLVIVDLGIGIPASVRKAQEGLEDAESAMRWAFGGGHSSKDSELARGLGLTRLKDFVWTQRARLVVVSHQGVALVSSFDGSKFVRFGKLKPEQVFPGTLAALEIEVEASDG